MNIWLVSKYASPPKYAKVPPRLFLLGREMVKKGHKVSLITSDSNQFANIPHSKNTYNDEIEDGVSIKWIKTKKYKKSASKERVLSWFDFEIKMFRMKLKNMDKPDVVIISSLSIFSIIYGYYLKKKYKSFLVFEIRDIWPLTMTEEGGFSKWHPLVLFIGMIEKFGYRKADLIVGTMPKLDSHIETILGYSKPFFCSPLGFDIEKYADENLLEDNPFLKYKIKEKTIIGYAGSMGVTNALDTYINTIKLMGNKKNIFFIILGSGALKESFEEQLKTYDNVFFLPRIKQSQIKYFLEICDVLYLSTQDSKVWDYGQSMNKVVEYMLASKPIVATYTGFPSMINEANCGMFAKTNSPEDLKEILLKYVNMTNKERVEIGKKGKDWIFKNRTYNKLAEEYLNAINKFNR